MENELFDGIALKLHDVFGDIYQIYGDDDVKQGLEEPCFFINVIEHSYRQVLGTRYLAKTMFDVLFFPGDGPDARCKMRDVSDRLCDAIEIVQLENGDLVRGNGMNSKIVDGVLHFMITYKMYLAIKEASELMETVDIDARPERRD